MTAAENAKVSWHLNFRVCVFLKSAVRHSAKLKYTDIEEEKPIIKIVTCSNLHLVGLSFMGTMRKQPAYRAFIMLRTVIL